MALVTTMGYLVHPPDAPVALRDRLFALLGAPLAWVLHLGAAYLLVTLACNTGRAIVRPGVAVLTVVCGGFAVAAGRLALKRWRKVQEARSWEHALDEAGGAHGLLLLVGVLNAVLFTALILLNGLTPFLVRVCAP